MTEGIGGNVARVRARIAAAAGRTGRRAEDIVLVAVTKKQPPEAVREAIRAGVAAVGENYVQEAQAKREALPPGEADAAQWHLLGRLQGNKAKLAVPLFDMVQSVDSVKLARALARQAQAVGKTLPILLQVHLGEETTKTGFPPAEAPDAAAEIGALEGLRLQGLMGIAPSGVDPRPHFALLRRLFEQLPPVHAKTLSMGMTSDFEAAIEEGATMVRIGTAIFGARQ